MRTRKQQLFDLRNFLLQAFGLTAKGWSRMKEDDRQNLYSEVMEFINGATSYEDFAAILEEAFLKTA